MSRLVRASAPGKCILMGEHAAVYGRPALVAAIDRRLYATVDIAAEAPPEVELRLPDLGVEETIGWRELAEYAEGRRRLWEEARAGADPALFARVRGEDRAHLVKTALGELLHFAGFEPKVAARVEISSELPLGSGFGSSAACATALLLAASAALGMTLSREQLFELALEAERRQHGAPSGVDNATVLHGGILWVEKDDAGRIVTTPLVPKRKPLLPGLRFFQSGEPAESTGAVVAAVKARRAEDPAAFELRLNDMEAATRELRKELEAEGPASPMELFRRFESHLEAIGVVPQEVQKVVREIESQGGAAKISGAGSLQGPGAGSLLVLDGPRVLPFKELKLELGAPGARLE